MMKLGKLPPVRNLNIFPLGFLTRSVELPRPPKVTDWMSKVTSWPMGRNDTIGDCTIAGGVNHMILGWSTYCGSPKMLSDEAIVDMYSSVTGYKPGDDKTDNGAIIDDVLSYWMTKGVSGDLLNSRVTVNSLDMDEVLDALEWFGGLNVGLQLPLSAMDQMDKLWDIPSEGLTGNGYVGSWGGHCVRVGRHEPGLFYCSTWGKTQVMTERFFRTYVDEVHGLINIDWISNNNLSPSGINLPGLLKYANILI